MTSPITAFPTREVALTDDKGNEVGAMGIYQAHSYPATLHKAPSVWIINDQKEILFQKRSQQKPIGAGWWGNGICGNVLPGESYEECAHRRLQQELNLSNITLEFLYSFTYKAYGNEMYGEYERDQVYLGTYNGEVVPNVDEVEEVSWIDREDLKEEVLRKKKENGHYIFPQETLELSLDELKAKTPPVEITINNRQLIITPWTWMMLQDSRLQEKLFA